MDIPSLLLPPAFGAVIGLVTNALAIRMLFRPYRELRVLGLRFQGTIPRRKSDIARTVSRVVASELLREEQVARRVSGPEVREALRDLALTMAARYQGRLSGSLADALTPDQQRALEQFLQRFLADLVDMAGRWLASAEGREAVAKLVDRVLELSPAELLRGEGAAARAAVAAQLSRVLDDPGLEGRLGPLLAWALVRFVGSERSLGEMLPPQLGQAVCGVLRKAVPELLHRFEGALLAPANVARLKRAVRAGIRTYLAETEGGMVKNLIRQAALLGQERILREADQVVDANLHRLRELVYEESNRVRVEQGVDEAVASLLRQKPAELLASMPAAMVEDMHAQLVAWLAGYLRSPGASSFLNRLVEEEFERLFHAPLRELVVAAAPEPGVREEPLGRLTDGLCRWLGQGGLATLVERQGPALVWAMVNTPLGPDSRLLAPTVVAEVTELALDQLLPVLAKRVPEILQVVDVQGLIEREILAFAPEDVERVILEVAGRELRAITWWGAGLGGLVGTLQSALHYFSG